MIGIPGIVVLVALAALLEVRGYACRSTGERWAYLQALALFAGAIVMTVVTTAVYDDLPTQLARDILVDMTVLVQAVAVVWLSFVAFVRPLYRVLRGLAELVPTAETQLRPREPDGYAATRKAIDDVLYKYTVRPTEREQ